MISSAVECAVLRSKQNSAEDSGRYNTWVTILCPSSPIFARLLACERPVDSNDPVVCESFQRLGKNEIGCAFFFFEPNHSEIRPALAFQDCHNAILLYLRLEMTIRSWFLPERINLRLTAFFDDLRKARRLYFEELHSSASVPLAIRSRASQRLTLPAKSPPENYGKEDQTTVAAFLPWRDS